MMVERTLNHLQNLVISQISRFDVLIGFISIQIYKDRRRRAEPREKAKLWRY